MAVVRSPLHLELARELGAARIIDASAVDAGDVLSGDGGVDASILFAPSSVLARQALRATRG